MGGQDGDPSGKRVLIVDDLIKSGGTIAEAAKAITGAGATAVSAFCTHAAGRVKDLLRYAAALHMSPTVNTTCEWLVLS